MSTILVTNDDGHDAPGIAVLADALRALGRVVVVAPDRDMSAVSHALTLTRPLRVRRHGEDLYSVDGTPTDCVNIGVFNLLEKKLDLVISGINNGYNLGDDITYSGTVSAAFEGTLLGFPSIAVSRANPARGGYHSGNWQHDARETYEAAAAFATTLARKVLDEGMPPDTLLSVNVPPPPLTGIRCTRLGKRIYYEGVVERIDPAGRQYYWIGGHPAQWADDARSDHHAVTHGCVSVTPLHLDMTHDRQMETIASWDLKLPQGSGAGTS